ncbi:MAG: winged helix-turn-helix domain-containing protein [Methylococcales bacterium]
MSEIVGTTAGEIWNFLDKNGSISVAKLIKEIDIDEKTVQRGIGWLAQEGKISIDIVNRAETISLI